MGIFVATSIGIATKTQKIVLQEQRVADAKNLLSVMEKSLAPTWQLSTVQMMFAAGDNGFGNEYWYRVDPSNDGMSSSPPSDNDVKRYLGNLLNVDLLPRGFNSPIEAGDVRVEFYDLVTDYVLKDAEVTAGVSHNIMAFLGYGQSPTTEFHKNVKFYNSVRVQFRKLMATGGNFAELLKQFTLPQYSGPAAAYIDSATTRLRGMFASSAIGGINAREFTENSELIVPSANEAGILAPLGGLVFHYDVSATFMEDTKPEEQYYYLDENVYEKRPFPLTVKAEDYLVALDCAGISGVHAFSSPNDMACDGGKIYACNTNIQGINGNLRAYGGSTGVYGCGEAGFKDTNAVDDSPYYCAAFKGNWIGGESWTCSRTVCTPVYDKGGKKTGEDCVTVDEPRSCPMECDLNGRYCGPQPDGSPC